jgi:hypothetical protein
MSGERLIRSRPVMSAWCPLHVFRVRYNCHFWGTYWYLEPKIKLRSSRESGHREGLERVKTAEPVRRRSVAGIASEGAVGARGAGAEPGRAGEGDGAGLPRRKNVICAARATPGTSAASSAAPTAKPLDIMCVHPCRVMSPCSDHVLFTLSGFPLDASNIPAPTAELTKIFGRRIVLTTIYMK